MLCNCLNEDEGVHRGLQMENDGRSDATSASDASLAPLLKKLAEVVIVR